MKVLDLDLHWPHEPLTVSMLANHPLSLRVGRSLIPTGSPSIPQSNRFFKATTRPRNVRSEVNPPERVFSSSRAAA